MINHVVDGNKSQKLTIFLYVFAGEESKRHKHVSWTRKNSSLIGQSWRRFKRLEVKITCITQLRPHQPLKYFNRLNVDLYPKIYMTYSFFISQYISLRSFWRVGIANGPLRTLFSKKLSTNNCNLYMRYLSIGRWIRNFLIWYAQLIDLKGESKINI